MSTPTDIVTACDRVIEVIHAEFPQLSPADIHFALCVLTATYTEAFGKLSDKIKRQP